MNLGPLSEISGQNHRWRRMSIETYIQRDENIRSGSLSLKPTSNSIYSSDVIVSLTICILQSKAYKAVKQMASKASFTL